MTERERFLNCLHYQEFDRIPFWDFGFWNETVKRWKKEGLPRDITYDETIWYRLPHAEKRPLEEYFGMDRQWRFFGPDLRLIPRFKVKMIEDKGTTEIIRGEDGVVCEKSKKNDSIPHFIDWTLKDRRGWEEYKKRLNHDEPRRLQGRKEKVPEYRDRDYPLGIFLGSLFGWIRNWMGLENVSLLLYDDAGLFAEMVEYITDFICRSVEPFLKAVNYDFGHFWEDMAFANGPMLSPKHFKEFLVPNYKKITSLLKKYGVDVVVVDCDGKIDDLLPLWLASGVNCMFPIEIGTWQADPAKLRERFGRQLLMIGGIDKRVLARTREDIDREIEKRLPLMKAGGYIPLPDHRVPPDVPFENYLYYLEALKKKWS